MKKTEKAKPKTKNSATTISAALSKLEVDEMLNVSKPEGVDDLAASISVMGLRHPIQVRRKRESDSFFILDGRCRFLAAKKAGLKAVSVVDNGYMNDVDAITISHVENWMRRKGNKKECINSCKLLRNAGLSVVEIGKRLFLSKSAVSNYLSIGRAQPLVRAAAEKGPSNGGISVHEAVKVSKLENSEQDNAVSSLIQAAVARTREACLPKVNEDIKSLPVLSQNLGVLMPGEVLSKEYRLASDYKERCKKLDAEIQKRLRRTPSNAKLLGMSLAIGVLRGKLTVEEALTNWDGL
jgi:ParB/RepB/Spo0J family partition protein